MTNDKVIVKGTCRYAIVECVMSGNESTSSDRYLIPDSGLQKLSGLFEGTHVIIASPLISGPNMCSKKLSLELSDSMKVFVVINFIALVIYTKAAPETTNSCNCERTSEFSKCWFQFGWFIFSNKLGRDWQTLLFHQMRFKGSTYTPYCMHESFPRMPC